MNTANLNFDLNQTTPVLCENCGHHYFEQAVHVRKVSGLITGTGQTSYLPIPVFACKSCGHVNTEFLPKELKDLGADESSTD